jgi:hypothetical protein
MKKISLLPVLLILFTFVDCRKSNSPTNKLPPETRDGDNTMGCYVDNHLFIPQEPAFNNNSFSGASVQRGPTLNLYLSWEDNSNSAASGLILIQLDSIQLVEGATYALGAPAS